MPPALALDRRSPMPLWAQLHHELRRRLDSGEFGERFPTDLELVNEYGVSRHTVRHAIGQLNATGVLTRERGRGTVVNKAEFEQSLGALYSLFESVEHTGVEQRSEVLQLTVASSDEARSHLELDHDDEMVLLERLRLAGDDPLAVDRAWLPATIARPLLTV
ncbi:MAG: GntR family transcriptional regulator, partial [Acidimicrobiia bacterium]|nr:GntR family transcriptional regulator [Acidimicrobiia bacterium]